MPESRPRLGQAPRESFGQQKTTAALPCLVALRQGIAEKNLFQLFRETGDLYPIRDIGQEQHHRFGLLMRGIYFSLLIVGANQKGMAWLLKISGRVPAGVTAFVGNDIWLQGMAALE